MRGTRYPQYQFELVEGITPAYAGNTKLHNRRGKEQWDHPRLCGEHGSPPIRLAVILGSPPPMRGTPINYHIGWISPRITPAYAGNTATPVVNALNSTDHPRLCGEHSHCRTFDHIHLGSPPPMRGTLNDRINAYNYYRITPAYAGNTSKRGRLPLVVRDHPRLCGEHFDIP